MCLRLEPAVSGTMRRCIAALLVLLAACAGAERVRFEPLAVPRCCPAGSELAPDVLRTAVLTRAAAAAACHEEPEPRPWAPLVYEYQRGRFLQRGVQPNHWSVAYGALPACDDLRVLPEHAAPYALLAGSGYLWLRSTGRSLPLTRYCSDVDAALFCLEDDEHPPSKCCAEGLVYDGAGCVEDAPRAAAALGELRALAAAVPAAGREPLLGVGWPTCTEGVQYSVRGTLAGAQLEANGSVRLADGSLVAGGAWCAEAEAGAEGARVLSCRSGEPELALARSPRHVLYGCGLAVNAAFLAVALAATLAAGCTLHWRCQTQYVASLMLADMLLAGTQLAGDRVPTTLCRALAVCMHFLFLAAFFWLNTMCFNIWWTRVFRLTSLQCEYERWRLRVSAVYAWGGPLFVAGSAALLDALPPPPEGPALPRPRFAEQRCWFSGDDEILVYYLGPAGVLLLVSLALFASTSRQLTTTSERAALGRACAKLVVIMYVTWGADMASWAAGGPEFVWYVADLLHALQGVLISAVVCTQPAMLSALHVLLCTRLP